MLTSNMGQKVTKSCLAFVANGTVNQIFFFLFTLLLKFLKRKTSSDLCFEKNCMLCIYTSEQVLRTQLAGQNHNFGFVSWFSAFFCNMKKEEKVKKKLNIHKKETTSVQVLLLNAGQHLRKMFEQSFKCLTMYTFYSNFNV